MDSIRYTIKILPCTGRRYVVPDIHGCLFTFEELLNKIDLKKTDQLFLLGDYIERGPSSVRVVDKILQLKMDGYQVYPMRGNHEEEFLLAEELGIKRYIQGKMQEEDLIGFFDKYLNFKPQYLDFFNSLPYYIELEDFILVHAGFDFNRANPFQDTDSMLEIRNWSYDYTLAKNKTIVFGHNPTHLDDIIKNIELKNKTIPLDNGCVYDYFEGLGNLLCLCLDDFKLIAQPNIELI